MQTEVKMNDVFLMYTYLLFLYLVHEKNLLFLHFWFSVFLLWFAQNFSTCIQIQLSKVLILSQGASKTLPL
jgi:hypothetical protein